MDRHTFEYHHKGISQYLIPKTRQSSLRLARSISETGCVTLQLEGGVLTTLSPGISVLACGHMLSSKKKQKLCADFIIVLIN